MDAAKGNSDLPLSFARGSFERYNMQSEYCYGIFQLLMVVIKHVLPLNTLPLNLSFIVFFFLTLCFKQSLCNAYQKFSLKTILD